MQKISAIIVCIERIYFSLSIFPVYWEHFLRYWENHLRPFYMHLMRSSILNYLLNIYRLKAKRFYWKPLFLNKDSIFSMTQNNEKGNIYFEDNPIYILLDIIQTTQAWSLLFIVRDLKSTYALDEQDLSLFQLESFMSTKGNNFMFLLQPLASKVLSSRLFYFHRGKDLFGL